MPIIAQQATFISYACKLTKCKLVCPSANRCGITIFVEQTATDFHIMNLVTELRSIYIFVHLLTFMWHACQ